MTTELFKIMSDQTRLRILVLLYHHDLCVCEMVAILNESQPKISKHIAKIRSLQLVSTNRNEQYIYYSLNRDNSLLTSVLSTLIEQISVDLPYKEDLSKLDKMDEFVCQGAR